MYRFVFMAALCLLTLPARAADLPARALGENLTVIADRALMQPLAQIARGYATRTQTPVTVVVKNPDTLAQQVEEGLEAHVLITASTSVLDHVSARGLVDVTSRRTIARTGLALITTRARMKQLGIAKRISFASVLDATGATPILTANDDTPEGAAARTLAGDPAFSEALRARLAARGTADEVLTSLHDEDALALLWATQAVNEPGIAVISLLPPEISPTLAYDAVVIGGELGPEAQQFVSYLASPEAEAILTRFGYQTK